MLLRVFASTVLFAFAVPGLASAQSPPPPCRFQHATLPFQDEGEEGAPPKFLTWGTRATVRLYAPRTPAMVTIAAADPARPIAQPAQGPQSESFQEHGIVSTLNDGPIRITVEWQDTEDPDPTNRYDQYRSCTMSSSVVIDTGVGKEPTVTARAKDDTVRFTFPGAGRCSDYRQASLRLIVWGKGGREEVRTTSPCADGYKRIGNNKLLTLKMDGKGAKFQAHDRYTNKDWTFRYKVLVDQSVVKDGRIEVDNYYKASKSIYGFKANGDINDAYWNYCVKYGKETWMEDGNPYCMTPGRSWPTVSLR